MDIGGKLGARHGQGARALRFLAAGAALVEPRVAPRDARLERSLSSPSGSSAIPSITTSSFTSDIASTMSQFKSLTAVRHQGREQPTGGGHPA